VNKCEHFVADLLDGRAQRTVGGRDSQVLSARPLAAEPLTMPTHDDVRVHDDLDCVPIPPGVGEQHLTRSISLAELGTPHDAFEH
jgi:hypothetical protein